MLCVSWKIGALNIRLLKGLSAVVLLFFFATVQAEPSLSADPASALSLPDLGSPNRAVLSKQQEQTLSLAFLQALYQQVEFITDPLLNDYVRGVGHRLLRQTNTDKPFQFYIIKNDSINAFAGPGGIIAIHSGLLLSAKTEDELAAVMAHEIEHVQQEHISRMFEQGKQGTMATLAGIVGALLVGSRSPQAAMAMMMGGVALSAQQQLAFSRDNEWEADRTGIDLLYGAGYDPNAMADFFETLANRYRTDSKVPEILLTHPVTTKRISDSRARAAKMKRAAKRDQLAFQYAKARLAALLKQTDGLPEALLCTLGMQPDIDGVKANNDNAHCKGQKTYWWRDLQQIQQNEQATTQAWQALYELYPQQIAVSYAYADWLVYKGKVMAAIDVLQSLEATQSEKTETWQRIGRLWHQQGNEHQEAFALAQSYAQMGDFRLAQIQVDRAQRHQAQASDYQQQRLEAFQAWLIEQQQQRKALE